MRGALNRSSVLAVPLSPTLSHKGRGGALHPVLRFALTRLPHRDLVSASQMPPPIMKPPETRDNSRVRLAENIERARPESSAYIASVNPAITMKVTPSTTTCEK